MQTNTYYHSTSVKGNNSTNKQRSCPILVTCQRCSIAYKYLHKLYSTVDTPYKNTLFWNIHYIRINFHRPDGILI